MPDLAIQFRWRRLQTDLGHFVVVRRPFVSAEVGKTRPLTFIDTGAPISVVSLSIANQITWTPLGAQFRPTAGANALDWHGIPCDLGETHIDLLDLPNGIRCGPFSLIAKFARQRHSTLENQLILRMNFLTDNDIDLHIYASAKPISGVLSVP